MNFGTRVSYRDLYRSAPRVSTRVSHKSAPQECPTRVSVRQECPTKVKVCVPQARVSQKSALQE